MGKGQTRTGIRASALATALALSLPTATFAAGLGELTVLSGLGEPLRAEVELNTTKEELATLSAKLAPAAAFRAAGIDLTSALRGVKVTVASTEGGQPLVRLATDYSVSDPFVDLLLEINWSAGRLVREFTFLLDPPDDVTARTPVVPMVPLGVGKATGSLSEPAPTAQGERGTEKPAPATPPDGKSKTRNKAVDTLAEKPEKPAKSTDTHKVVAGETLARIAEEARPEGVSLDQMLVALVHGNPDAFDNGNVNRLRAGKILQMPDAATAASVTKEEAHKQVVAQSTDFNAYRRKLAAQVVSAPAPKDEVVKQGASGKLSARVEDKLPAPADKGDRLKVSRTDTSREGVSGTAGGKPGGPATEEQLVAREKALKEANSRLVEVEKNVKELQQLVEMKNQALSDLQKQAGSKGAPPPAQALSSASPAQALPAVQPAAVPSPGTPAVAGAVPAQPAPGAQSTATKPVLKKPVVVAPPPEPPSFFESLLDDPLTLFGGGGIVAVLLAYFGYKTWQRRKENQAMPAEHSQGPLTVTSASGTPSIFGSAGGRSVDTSASAIQTDFSQSGLSAIDTDEGVDPVAEADVYMAYGRDAQAEEILLDALKTEPDRQAIRVKLLEIYAQRRNMLQFETVAGELYAHTGGSGTDWEKAAVIGRKLDPHNPLYARGAKEEPAARPAAEVPRRTDGPEAGATQPQGGARSSWNMPVELNQIAAAVSGGAAAQASKPAAAQPAADLDFDLGLDFPTEEEEGNFDSTVVLGGPRAGFSMNDVAASDFHIDMDDDLDSLDKPKSGGGGNLDMTNIQGFGADPEGSLDLDFTALHGSTRVQESTDSDMGMMDLERTEVGGNLLDFELGDEEPAATTSTVLAPAIDLSNISLDLHDVDGGMIDLDLLDSPRGAAPLVATPRPLAVPTAEPDADPAAVEETNTKLELAQAYEEMGDREGARELLQEVLQEGNADQRKRAKDALSRVG